jgi:hypothetical protein
MKKTFIFVLLLLSLFAYKVNAAPNTGNLPENGVKVNFNANGTYSSVEGSGWAFNQSAGSLTLTKGEVVITLSEYVFKDGNEIIGFSWTIEGATAVLWVKHGRTSEIYGEGMEGEFTTSDRKGVSNAVFLIEIIDDEDEELDEEEELDDEEEQDDEEEEIDEEEQDDEEEVVDEEEVLGDDEENEEEIDEEVEEEEDEVLGESDEDEEAAGDGEELPDTSDASKGLGYVLGLMGLFLLVVSKKKAVA